MLEQPLFFTMLHALGTLLGHLFKNNVRTSIVYLIGFPLGLLIWVLLALLTLCLGIPYTAPVMAVLLVLTASALVFFNTRFSLFNRHDLRPFLTFTCGFALLSIAACSLNYTVLSYDSYKLLEVGRAIGYDGYFHPDTQAKLASWGIFLPMVQSASIFLGLDYLYGLQPVLFVCLLASLFCLATKALHIMKAPSLVRRVYPALAVLALMSTYFIVFQGFYIHNSMPSAVYLFLFCSTVWIARTQNQPRLLALGMLFLAAFTLQRMEGPLFALIFLVLVMTDRQLSYRHKVLCLLPYAGLVFLWYSKLYFMIGSGSDILDREKITKLLSPLGAFTFVIVFSRARWIARLVGALPWVMLYVIAGKLLIVALDRPDHMAASLSALVQNILKSGNWGVTWVVLFVLFTLAHHKVKLPHGKVFFIGIPSFLMFLFVLSSERIPYRVGWGDSANRILTHILPVLLFYVLLRLGQGQSQTEAHAAEPASRRVLFMEISVACLILFGIMLFPPPTKDMAKDAVVLSDGLPVFCAPDAEGPHDFNVALRGRADSHYVAAAEPGPATITLDLTDLITADTLEMVQYDPNESFTSYAWHTSVDKVNWTEVYDTNSRAFLKFTIPSNDATQYPTTRYTLSHKEPFRYLRLTFRSAKGQNRLLLRKISVYKMEESSTEKTVSSISLNNSTWAVLPPLEKIEKSKTGNPVLTKNSDSLTVEIADTKAPDSLWSTFVRIPLSLDPKKAYTVSFRPEGGRYNLSLLTKGQTFLRTAKGSLIFDRDIYLSIPHGESNVTLMLYHPKKAAGRTVYRDIRILMTDLAKNLDDNSQPPLGPWSDLVPYMKTHLLDPAIHLQSTNATPHYKEIVEHFTTAVRDIKRLIASEKTFPQESLRDYLHRDFAQAKALFDQVTPANDKDLVAAVYACTLAHFLVDYTRLGNTEVEKILIAGNGSCLQQGLAADYIAGIITGQSYTYHSFDNIQLGHAVSVGPRCILDVTNNLVIFCDMETWNNSPDYQRAKILLNQTYYGVCRAFNRELDAVSYDLFKSEGNVDNYLRTYEETLQILPTASLRP